MRDLIVLGGGITGLAAAYLAAKAGRKVTVLEASPELGGLLRTFPVGGNRLECYYHHFFTHDVEFRWLLQELGIEDHLEFFPATMGIFREGKTYPFDGIKDLFKFRPLGLLDKLRFGLSSAYLGKLADWRRSEHESAQAWLRRYAGPAASEAIWTPLLNIKFGPFADQVPVAWMVGRLKQRMSSRERGEEKLGYVRGSLSVVLERLLAKLHELGVEFITSAPVQSLQVENGKVLGVTSAAGEFSAEAVLATIPTPVVAKLAAPHDLNYANALRRIEYFGAVCVVLEMSAPLSGIYWLNVADAGYPFGGVIEHTNLIHAQNYQGTQIAYLSRYFAADDPLATMSEEEVIQAMLPPLARVSPGFSNANIRKAHVFRTMTAAVVCDLNFSSKVPHCRSPLQNFYLANMVHVYPDERSCNNSIRVAAEACRVMGMDSAMVPRKASLAGQIHMD